MHEYKYDDYVKNTSVARTPFLLNCDSKSWDEPVPEIHHFFITNILQIKKNYLRFPEISPVAS